MKTRSDSFMIAPCGMNCALCLGHQRDKKQCPGCRGEDTLKSKSRINCIIINCEKRKGKKADYCYVCDTFPCARLKALDKRYRTNYNMSMLENLENIKNHGVDMFVESEMIRWKCDKCGGLLCVHRDECRMCGK